VVQNLLGKGYNIKLYDSNVELSRVIGKNKSYIMAKLPHIAKLLTNSVESAVDWADIVVITNKEEEYMNLFIDDSKIIFDFAYLKEYSIHPNYEGLNW